MGVWVFNEPQTSSTCTFFNCSENSEVVDKINVYVHGVFKG